MSTLFILCLEPLEERYTGQWYTWLFESLGKGFDSVRNILGRPLTDKVKVGAFLDLNSTAHYKATQLAEVAKRFYEGEIKDGDAFWVSDIEFWGIESIRYLARLQGINVKMFGFLHAASYTHEDFMAPMEDIGQYVEPAWIASFDRVYVGSEYHRQRVIRARLTDNYGNGMNLADRIVVTGNPWRSIACLQDASRSSTDIAPSRGIDLCFPHRPDHEKRPGVFLRAALELEQKLGRKLNIAFTTGREEYRSTNDPEFTREVIRLAQQRDVTIYKGLKRGAFYNVLGHSKVVVSTAIEENFGYAMVEAMTMGALPLMPNAYSYPELVQGDKRFLYDQTELKYLVNGMENLLALPFTAWDEWSAVARHYAQAFDGSEQRILNDMLAEMPR
jgi:glycosyltransferase involved in cell wall biosynthesis